MMRAMQALIASPGSKHNEVTLTEEGIEHVAIKGMEHVPIKGTAHVPIKGTAHVPIKAQQSPSISSAVWVANAEKMPFVQNQPEVLCLY